MVPCNSQVDIYVDLYRALFLSISDYLGPSHHKSLLKDLEVLTSRFKSEGLSFLTKTLPRLGKAFDVGISSSKFTCPREFKTSPKQRSIPAFLQACFNLVFDENGALRTDCDLRIIYFIRQVTFLCYKLELEFSERDISIAIQKYLDIENSIQGIEFPNEELLLARNVTADFFKDFDPEEIIPQHGPGAVATGEKGQDKYLFKRRYKGLDTLYPAYRYLLSFGGRELIDRISWYKNLQQVEESVSKVLFVPKDSRGPRTISMEPLEFMWIQKGLSNAIVAHIESSSLTSGQVNFRDQSVNQYLALSSSLNGAYATIDLSDASDRVSTSLVRSIFKHTKVLKYLEATRTEWTELPNGQKIKLNKFAPMGSALCFPIEAYVFWVLAVSAITLHGTPLSQSAKLVFVYGDDIIVPTQYYDCVTTLLEKCGLKVNHLKSFRDGNFRESCGIDAFFGESVTPVKLRTVYQDGKAPGASFTSYLAYANLFAKRGFPRVAKTIFTVLEKRFGRIPYSTSISSFPGKNVQSPVLAEILNKNILRCRWKQSIQQWQFYVYRLKPIKHSVTIDGWLRLTRSLKISVDGDPGTYTLPRQLTFGRRWEVVA